MSAAAEYDEPWLSDTYRERLVGMSDGFPAPVFDEFLGPDGVRPAYAALAEQMEAMGRGGLLAARAEVARFVSDEDMTYGGTDLSQATRWLVDPLPLIIGTAEWRDLEAGLRQRAELLDAILSDLYTKRHLLQRGLIPPQLVVGHPEFVLQADGIRLKGRRQLVLAATDLVRDGSGWRVLSDRTQAPSGAGYVMGTRRIVTRTLAGLHRRTETAFLRDFFRTMASALQDAAPTSTELPRVVVFSPGTASETAYDQAFTATLLGFPLVQAEDLVMRQGRVWVTDGDGLEPVDVILRRVDSAFADPLELRSDSRLGLPGLIEASRQGHVTIVNPIGSGVLENPGLAAFLPRLAREVLDEDLALHDPQTWWCGNDADRSHVLANIDSLVLKPTHRSTRELDRFGWELSSAEREELVARIKACPWEWVGEEALSVSTSPVVTAKGLVPRRTVLRTFGVGVESGYTFMHGGLGRVAGGNHPYLVSNSTGALAKDVWVLTGATTDQAADRTPVAARAAGRPPLLSPRVAENLFWLGRYANRAENTARLIVICEDLDRDYAYLRGPAASQVLQAMLSAFSSLTGHPADLGNDPRGALHAALVGTSAGCVAASVQRLTDAAHEVRNVLSVDTWSMLSRLERTLDEARADHEFQPHSQKILESFLAWSGIMAESMVRDETYSFLDAGARIERALHTVDLMRRAFAREQALPAESRLAEAVLAACESLITYRRRVADGEYRGRPLDATLRLLLWDPSNPRSVLSQLTHLAADLRLAGDATVAAEVEKLGSAIAGAETQDPSATDVLGRLSELSGELRGWSDRLTRRHFTRHSPIRAQQPGWNTPWQVV
ncbi:circularly permuted type 2 ATP-grasp protein [Propionicicella superfundia]|uniref:circularly permuted type 2 ATP-grasp protein n=1 Tax=Propionicicella superfundia TaxID=348582 RepID=UPI000685623F|nr:circularly permuted type 2 ATP-grasp protein [Propionicicella superfundia]